MIEDHKKRKEHLREVRKRLKANAQEIPHVLDILIGEIPEIIEDEQEIIEDVRYNQQRNKTKRRL